MAAVILRGSHIRALGDHRVKLLARTAIIPSNRVNPPRRAYSEECVLVYAVTARECFDVLVDFCVEFVKLTLLSGNEEPLKD